MELDPWLSVWAILGSVWETGKSLADCLLLWGGVVAILMMTIRGRWLELMNLEPSRRRWRHRRWRWRRRFDDWW